MKRTLASLALVAATTACVTPSTAPPEIPFSVPAAWDLETAASTAPERSWWRTFDDPQLEALVEEALDRSPTLDAARARLAAAVATARIAGAELKPSLEVGLDGARRRQNFIGLPIPGTEGRVLSNTSTTLGLSLSAAWEVDLWGRISAGAAAATARGDAAAAEFDAVRLSLVGQIARAWFTVAEAQEQVELALETLSNRQRTRQQIEDRYVLGLRPALDLRLASASEADARAQLAERRQRADAATRRLEVLVARYPGGDSFTAEARLPVPGPTPLAGEPAELVTRRPDLIAAEGRLAAAGLDVQGAKAALYPRLRLGGSVGRSSVEIGDLLDDDFSVWSLAAGLLQPLLQGGRLRATIDVAEARRQEAAADYINTALTAFNEVETALATERFVSERLAALAAAAEQALAARDLAERRYRSGLTEYLTVLESQRQATASQSLLVAARRQLLDTRIDLHLALGGSRQEGPEPASRNPS